MLLQASSGASVVVPVLDARRGQVYFGIYRRTANGAENCLALDGEEYVMTPAEFFEAVAARMGSAEFTIVTPTPEVIRGVAISK